MCDINKKINLKTKTVYKVVWVRPDGKYCSCFAGTLLNTGMVTEVVSDIARDDWGEWHDYDRGYMVSLRNKNMKGRVSGFGLLKDAQSLRDDSSDKLRVLRIKLGGNIMSGTTKNIGLHIPGHHKTYAGTEILSMEEI